MLTTKTADRILTPNLCLLFACIVLCVSVCVYNVCVCVYVSLLYIHIILHDM